MKTLILIRHAKSSWHDVGARDIDRKLNHRGKSDAPAMARRLAARLDRDQLKLEVFLCSSAQRAAETGTLLVPALGFPPASIDWRNELYLASPATMLELVRSVPDHVTTAALLAHNPGISELAEQMTGAYVGNVPTCGIITLRLPIASWGGADGRAELVDFDFPKRLPA